MTTAASHAIPSSAAHAAHAVRAGEITVTSLCKSYGEAQFTKEVVKDCSFTIERGKLTVMIEAKLR